MFLVNVFYSSLLPVCVSLFLVIRLCVLASLSVCLSVLFVCLSVCMCLCCVCLSVFLPSKCLLNTKQNARNSILIESTTVVGRRVEDVFVKHDRELLEWSLDGLLLK